MKLNMKFDNTTNCQVVAAAQQRVAEFATGLKQLWTKTTIAIVSLVLLTFSGNAANWYVRPGGAGSKTGADWNNAWDFSGVVQSSLSPGDTVWFAGGTYAAYQLEVSVSGKSGNPINFYRVRTTDAAPTAAAGWQTSFDSQVILQNAGPVFQWNTGTTALGSWINIDGRAGQNGILVNYTTLTSGGHTGAFDFNAGGPGVHDVSINHVEVAGPGWNNTFNGDQYAISCDAYPGSLTNITVSYCNLHDMLGAFNCSLMYNLIVDHCNIHDTGDNGSGSHADVLQLYLGQYIFRYCTFHDCHIGMGFEQIGTSGTANSGPTVTVYGCIWVGGKEECVIWNADSTSLCTWYNNTVVDALLGFAPQTSYYDFTVGSTFINNLFYNCNVACLSAGDQSENYDFAGACSTGPVKGANSINAASPAVPFVTYVNGNFTDSNYHLTSAIGSTSPRNNGTPISNVGSATFNIDIDGNVRGADGAWDMGAYEYSSGTSTNPLISVTPSVLSFGTVATNVSVTNSVVVQNVGAGTLVGTASASSPFKVVSGGAYSLGPNQSAQVSISYTPVSANDSGIVSFTGGGGASVSVSGQLLASLSGLSFQSYAGTITAPFSTNGGYVSQTVDVSNEGQAGVTNGGWAVYAFNISAPGSYTVSANVSAPNAGSKSFWVNMDVEPTDPTMIWDIFPYTSGFETRTVSWRGSGTATNDQFVPEVFNLSAGAHQLIVVGREPGVQLGQITIAPYSSSRPSPPVNLRIVASQ